MNSRVFLSGFEYTATTLAHRPAYALWPRRAHAGPVRHAGPSAAAHNDRLVIVHSGSSSWAWSMTAAPALLTISSWESVPPEQPIAPIIIPCSISGTHPLQPSPW